MRPFPDLEVMLAKPSKQSFDRPGWIFEFKYDGWRVVARKRPGAGVVLRSRHGTDLTGRFPAVVGALAKLRSPSFTLDGELCWVDDQGVPDFEALQAAGRTTRFPGPLPSVLYFAFDLLEAGGQDLRARPLIARKRRLKTLLASVPAQVRYVDHIEGQGLAAYAFAVEHRFEGLIAKDAAAPYVEGRSDRWLKIKPAGTHAGWKRPLRHRGR